LLVVGKVYRFLKLYKKHGGRLLFVRSKLEKIGVKKIDYIKLINLFNFKEVKKISSNTNIFIAYYLNGVRLIDNL
jgi:pantoate--beta-alanine ligase